MTGILAQLNTSQGGIPKTAVLMAHVSRHGVDGDKQRNRKYHGGPDRAVCVFSEELYADLRDEGVDLVNGAVGENFTTRGLNLQALSKGDRLRVGAECVIEITNVREPCRTLTKWSPDLPWMIEGRSGWVAKVVSEGIVRPGDPIEVLPRQASATTSRNKAKAGAA
jgi:MOSC domain-containing protein YiiM